MPLSFFQPAACGSVLLIGLLSAGAGAQPPAKPASPSQEAPKAVDLKTIIAQLEAEDPAEVRKAADRLRQAPPQDVEEQQAAAEAVKSALTTTKDAAAEAALRLALGKLAAAAKSVELAEWGFESMSVTHGPKTPREVFGAHVKALEMVPGAAKELLIGNLDVAINLPEAEPRERQRIKEFVTLTAEAMRTRELADFLDALLRGEENLFVRLDAPLEARLLACYRNLKVDPPINADSVAEWIDKNPGGPSEVEVAALETMSLVGVKREDAIDKLADRLLARPADAVVVAKSLLAGRLNPRLKPKIKAALLRYAEKDAAGDAAAILKQLDR